MDGRAHRGPARPQRGARPRGVTALRLRRHGTAAVYRGGVPNDQPFQIVDASSWEALSDEPMGSKAKEWLLAPDGTAWLFKWVREKEDKR